MSPLTKIAGNRIKETGIEIRKKRNQNNVIDARKITEMKHAMEFYPSHF